MNKQSTYQTLANQLKLLAHPERLRILDILRREPECVCHLEMLLDKPQPYVSQQLRLLRKANMIIDERRGHNIYYQLADERIREWLEQILGPAKEDPQLAVLKKTLPCECPTCATNLQISFAPQYPPETVEINKAKLLFLCTGNSARSQMAEAFMREYAGDQFDVYSAGLEPRGIHPLTVRVMDEIGMDISQQQSTDLHEYLGRVNFGYLITVCERAEKNCPTAFLNSGGERMDWFFDDPAAIQGAEEARLAKFRTIRDQIDGRIKVWLTERIEGKRSTKLHEDTRR